MNLPSGHKLGPYEIVSFIGAGAMGQVYRARDTRLDRTVALKVLPGGVSPTSVLRARFEREARAIAALSHPNICAIHDVGSENGTEYLVMEYLDGETLADRIGRGPLPVQQAIRYGLQIAEALQQAHRAGITHRDLKPGNIMITAAGAKLLDFGLAKTIHEETARLGHDAPTVISPLTNEGTIVGTFQYMSPEQIEGRGLDHRTDLFALGVILYEMLTGRRPFGGGSSSAIAAAILASDPPSVRTLQPNVPPALERIIVTALEKNPDDRWQTAQDVAHQLRWLSESSSSAEPVRRGPSHRVLFTTLAVAAVAAVGTWATLHFANRPRPAAASLVRLDLSAPRGLNLVALGDLNSFAIAPDGKSLLFLASAGGPRALYLRDFASREVRKIDGSEDAGGPFWSPDGEWIGFSARGTLWKTKRSGDSPPRALCDVAIGGAIATWSGQTILFSDSPDGRREIFRVSDDGGAATPVTHPSNAEWRHTWPQFLPDGRHFVYHASSSRTIDRELVLASVDGARKGVLLRNVSVVRLSGKDQLMYVRDGKLLAQSFDPSQAKVTGEPTTVADDISYFYQTARADFDAVPAGAVVYRTDASRDVLSIVDRAGKEKKVVDGDGRFFDVTLSPDATKAAVTVIDRGTGLGDIWLYDLRRGVRDRLTSDPGMEFSPLWSVDGRWIYHASAQGGTVPQIVRRGIDGTPPVEVTARGSFRFPESMTPDGEVLYFVDRNARAKTDIYRLPLRGGKPEALLATSFVEDGPQVSPDGEWLAYTSDATGVREVYVQRLGGDASARIRVSSEGGAIPKWRNDGRELFYLSNSGRSISAARSVSGRWDDASAEPLFTTPVAIVDYVAFPDGNSFFLVQSTVAREDAFGVILGWR